MVKNKSTGDSNDFEDSPSQQDLFLAIEQADHETLNQLKVHLEAELKARQDRAYEENRDQILKLFKLLNMSDRAKLATEIIKETLSLDWIAQVAFSALESVPSEQARPLLLEAANRHGVRLSQAKARPAPDEEEAPSPQEQSEEESEESSFEEEAGTGKRGKRGPRGIMGIYVNSGNPDEYKKSPRTPKYLRHVPNENWQYIKIEDMSEEQKEKYEV